eukprot:2701342-Pleurochrysis_carterae.AAC.1
MKSLRRSSIAVVSEFLLGDWPQPSHRSTPHASFSSSACCAAPTLTLQPVAHTKSQRSLERALVREVRAHAETKLKLAAKTASESKLALKLKNVSSELSALQQLQKAGTRLVEQLKKRPTEEVHQTLLADLHRAEQKMRSMQRQAEDAASRGARAAASLIKERDAACKLAKQKEKECAAARQKGEASEKLAHAAVRKAEMIRSGAAAVTAEKRAAAAEAQVEALQMAAHIQEAELLSAKASASLRQQSLLQACEAATREAESARSITDDLRSVAASNSEEIRVLQRDLSSSFAEMEAMKSAFAMEKELAVTEVKAACAKETALAVTEVKDNMVRTALLHPDKICSQSHDIVSATLRAAEDEYRSRPVRMRADGTYDHKGQYRTYVPLLEARKDASTVGGKALRTRSHEVTKLVNKLSGGKEHAAALMADHAKANQKLYQEIGMKFVQKLNVEQTAAFCNETSGALGAAMRRHLADCGIKVASRDKVQSYFAESWEECETGKITTPHPKKRGQLLTGAWLRVNDLIAVIQRSLLRFAERGELAWPANISGQENWFELIIDKGSSATKIIVKYLCISTPESVRNASLVGMLDRVKDTYDMMSIFQPLFDQFNDINRRGLCVWLPWQQLLPRGVKAAPDDQMPIED